MSPARALLAIILMIGVPGGTILGMLWIVKRIKVAAWRSAQRVFPPLVSDAILRSIPDALLWLDIDGWGYGKEFARKQRDIMNRPLLFGEQALHIPICEFPYAPPLGWEGLEPLAIRWSNIEPGYDECHFIVSHSPFATLAVSAQASKAILSMLKSRP